MSDLKFINKNNFLKYFIFNIWYYSDFYNSVFIDKNEIYIFLMYFSRVSRSINYILKCMFYKANRLLYKSV